MWLATWLPRLPCSPAKPQLVLQVWLAALRPAKPRQHAHGLCRWHGVVEQRCTFDRSRHSIALPRLDASMSDGCCGMVQLWFVVESACSPLGYRTVASVINLGAMETV